MLAFAMRLLAPVDRFSQKTYMSLMIGLLKAAGIKVEGRPLWISHSAYIDRAGGILLGDRCVISHKVSLLTHDFSLDRVAESIHGQTDRELSRSAPITIGERAFIGMGAYILPGISIGAGSIVGTGSVVTKDVEPGSVVAGNPARKLGNTSDLWERRRGEYSWHLRRR